MPLKSAALHTAGSLSRPSFPGTITTPDAAAQLTFADNALERLIDAFYAVFELAVLDRQLFGDDVSAPWKISGVGGAQKNGLISVEFVIRHDVFARGGAENYHERQKKMKRRSPRATKVETCPTDVTPEDRAR